MKERLEANAKAMREAMRFEDGEAFPYWYTEQLEIAQALQEQAERYRAEGSHWRLPYQAHAYDWADALAPRNEAPGREKESTC